MISYLEGWAARMIEFWNGFMSDKGTEIAICMENVFDPEYEPLLAIAQNVEHPAFGLCLDVGHAHCFTDYPVLAREIIYREEATETLVEYLRLVFQ